MSPQIRADAPQCLVSTCSARWHLAGQVLLTLEVTTRGLIGSAVAFHLLQGDVVTAPSPLAMGQSKDEENVRSTNAGRVRSNC